MIKEATDRFKVVNSTTEGDIAMEDDDNNDEQRTNEVDETLASEPQRQPSTEKQKASMVSAAVQDTRRNYC